MLTGTTKSPSSSQNRIEILPALVAERIAAGEVIERPASVVKELVENAIDAGATRIEIRLQKGGCDLIEVTDNGTGMSSRDLEYCVCRHATSKISKFEDLTRLLSLGFRGEALPSIASVSGLKILSKTLDGETHEVVAEHTAPKKAEAKRTANYSFLGSPHGTRIRVTSLFSQIPARLKFLKSTSAETGAVREIIERLALTHPEIGFQLFSDDRTLLSFPSETLKSRAERMLSEDNPFEVLHTRLDGPWGIEVIWLKGLSQPHTRSIYQIVNGRALRDRTLQQAILSPLRQSFLPGNFPSIVVKLDIPADELDVNAHPTKTEVRFLDSKKVFALCSAALEKLTGSSMPGSLDSGYRMNPFVNPMDNSTYNSTYDSTYNSTDHSTDYFTFEASPFGSFKGVWFLTYLVFEQKEEILLVDQHAAHERIRFEKLKSGALKKEKIESQTLLVPEVIKLESDKIRALKARLGLMGEIGFECEVFSEESILVRSVPAIWGMDQLSLRLKNLFERMIDSSWNSGNSHPVWDEALFEKVAMEACRSSIKAGDLMNEFGAIDLTRKLFQCEHPGNCPHGRVTFIKISKAKVEEWFNRKL